MKEHYVTYEQSVKLKDLGFDWKCYHYYNSAKRLVKSTTFSRTFRASDCWHNFNEYDRNSHSQPIIPECSAPRLDQAAAWLRKQYGIHVSANPYSDCSTDADGKVCDEWYFWSFELMRVPSGVFMDDANGEYDSYELALSAGIDAALELLTEKLNKKMTNIRLTDAPIGYLRHEATITSIAVYKPIPRFQRFFIRLCFGLKYQKA